MEWFIAALQKYADFTGRARRMEYWMFMLFSSLCGMAVFAISAFTAARGAVVTSVLPLLYSVGLILPTLAVTVRRLHDTGRSGWWYFIGLVPIIGAIVLFVWMCTGGTPGDIQYGPNPKFLAI